MEKNDLRPRIPQAYADKLETLAAAWGLPISGVIQRLIDEQFEDKDIQKLAEQIRLLREKT